MDRQSVPLTGSLVPIYGIIRMRYNGFRQRGILATGSQSPTKQ